MSARTTQVLVAVNVAVAALLAWLWLGPQGGARATTWVPPAPIRPDLGAGTPMLTGFEDADTSRYMAILDRPVFSPSRKPAPVASGPAGAPDPMQGIHLYGIYGGSQGGGVIVRVDGRSRRVKVSEALGDWTLQEVRGTQAVFARGAEVRTLALVQARPGAGQSAGASPGIGGPGAPGGPQPAPRNAMVGGSNNSVLADLLRRRSSANRSVVPAPSAPTETPASPSTAPSNPPPAAPAAGQSSPSVPPGKSSGASPFSIGGSR